MQRAKHAPEPLQAKPCAHSISGSVPGSYAVQMPGFGEMQLLQVPVQAAVQHTPSAQNPVRHWLFAVHAIATSSLRTHAGAAQ